MSTMLELLEHVLETHFWAERELSPLLDPLQQKPTNILSQTGKSLKKSYNMRDDHSIWMAEYYQLVHSTVSV